MHLEYFKKEILPLKNKLFRFANSYLGNKAIAEDIIQEVFLKIWNKRNELDNIRNIEAWSMTLTKNLVMDHFRETQSQRIHPDYFSDRMIERLSPDVLYEQAEKSDMIKYMINSLPLKQKEVIILREIEQYSYKEIAGIMGIDLNLVKITLFRARENLRKELLKNEHYGR